MTVYRLDESLAARRAADDGILLPYLLIDRARRRQVRAIAEAAREAGAAGIELGFPFSDPIADGPLLAAASARALRAGTDWSDLLAGIREAGRHLAVGVMTYGNPLFHRGVREACRALADAGASALIVPDLSLEDSAEWGRATHSAGLSLVRFAAPSTTPARLGRIARRTQAFLYVVSRYGTTGRAAPGRDQVVLRRIFRRAHEAAPGMPALLGFGIGSAVDARQAVGLGADGVIVGSAVEAAIGPRGSAQGAARLLRPIGRVLDAPAGPSSTDARASSDRVSPAGS